MYIKSTCVVVLGCVPVVDVGVPPVCLLVVQGLDVTFHPLQGVSGQVVAQGGDCYSVNKKCLDIYWFRLSTTC